MRHLWAVLLAVALPACDGVITYGKIRSKSSVPESMYALAVEKGAMVAEVRGNPFSIPDARLSELVRGYMKNGPFGQNVRFDAAPSAATVAPYRVVVVFNATTGPYDDDICAGRADAPAGSGAGRMTVAMVFCFGSESISGTWGSVGGVSGPDDPKFRALIEQTTLTLIPIFVNEPDTSD